MPATVTATYKQMCGFAFGLQGRQIFGERGGCAQDNGGEEKLHKSAILRHDSLTSDREAPTWSARQMARMSVLDSISLGRYADCGVGVCRFGRARRRWCCKKRRGKGKQTI